VTGVSQSAGSKVSYKVKMRGSEEERNSEPRYVRHIDTIQLTDHAIDAAIVHGKLYGAGLSGKLVEEGGVPRGRSSWSAS